MRCGLSIWRISADRVLVGIINFLYETYRWGDNWMACRGGKRRRTRVKARFSGRARSGYKDLILLDNIFGYPLYFEGFSLCVQATCSVSIVHHD